MNERIFSGRFELFVFFHSRLFHTYFTFLLLSLFLSFLLLSPSHSFFNLFLFAFSFYLTPLLPSYTALGDFSLFFFSCHSSSVRAPGRIFVLFYFRRLHFSFSFDAYVALCPFRVVRAVASFIVFVPRCPPCLLCSAATAPIPLQVFHARKRAFSYFSRLPFSRVRPTIAREHPARSATWHFPFSFSVCTLGIRYVIRSTLSWYCPFLPRKVHSSGVSRFRTVFFSPFLIAFTLRSSSLFLLKFLALRYFARWAILENTIRSIPSHYPR